MALSKIGDLTNGVGLIYEVTPGSTILNNYPNTRESIKLLRIRGLQNAIIYAQNTGETGVYTENFNDPDGNRYFLDSNSGATALVVSGDAIDITKYLLPITKNPAYSATIAAGVLTLQRFGAITIVDVLPECGTSDDFLYIKGLNFSASTERDFQNADIVILRIASTYNITAKNNTSGDGYLAVSGKMDYVIKGGSLTGTMAFMKQSTNGWMEVFRSNTTVQTKKYNVSGGAQVIDPSSDPTPANRITNQDGVIFLDATGVTQTGAFQLSTSDALPGQQYTIKPIGNWTDITTGSITIFGKAITAELAKKGGWQVQAIYDAETSVWRASLEGNNPITYAYFNVPALSTYYENKSLIGLSVGDFMVWIGGNLLTFTGSQASANFNSVLGRCNYNSWTPDIATEGMLIILKQL